VSAVIVNIDCTETDVCVRARIGAVPTFLLICRRSSKYLITAQGRPSGEWASLLQSKLGSSVREIASDDDLNKHVLRTIEGATSFHLTLPKSETGLLKTYEQFSANFHIFGCSFGHIFAEESKPAPMNTYFSPVCGVVTVVTADNISRFLNRFRFSDFHHYNMMEWHEQIRDHRFGLVIVSEHLKDSEKRAFYTFSSQVCNRIRFSWGLVRTELNLFRSTNVESEEAPLLFVTGKVEGRQCMIIAQKKIDDASHLAMFEGMIKGE
jgi:hypothetical protein